MEYIECKPIIVYLLLAIRMILKIQWQNIFIVSNADWICNEGMRDSCCLYSYVFIRIYVIRTPLSRLGCRLFAAEVIGIWGMKPSLFKSVSFDICVANCCYQSPFTNPPTARHQPAHCIYIFRFCDTNRESTPHAFIY